MPEDDNKFTGSEGRIIFQGSAAFPSNFCFDRSTIIEFDLVPGETIASNDAAATRTLTFLAPLEWKRGTTSQIDIKIQGQGSKIIGDDITHPGSLTIIGQPHELSERTRFFVEGERFTIGKERQGTLEVAALSEFIVRGKTLVNTSSFRIAPQGILDQQAVIESTSVVHNEGTHLIGAKLQVKSPADRYVISRPRDFLFPLLQSQSESALIKAARFENRPGTTGEILVPPHTRLELQCDSYSFYSALTKTIDKAPRIDVDSGELRLADIQGKDIPIEVYSDSWLTLRGDARFDQFPVLSTSLTFQQSSEGTSITQLEDIKLSARPGVALVILSGSLHLNSSSITLGSGGRFALGSGRATGAIRGSGAITAPEIYIDGLVNPNLVPREHPPKPGKLTFTARDVAFDQSATIVSSIFGGNPGSDHDLLEINGRFSGNPNIVPMLETPDLRSWMLLRGARLPIVTYTSLEIPLSSISISAKSSLNTLVPELNGELTYTDTAAVLAFPNMKQFDSTSKAQIPPDSLDHQEALPLSDFDGDGTTNLEEHAFGTPLNQKNGSPIELHHDPSTPEKFIFSFPMADDLTDVDVTLEGALDSNWKPKSFTELDPMSMGDGRTKRRFQIDGGDQPASLFRLRIDLKP